MLCNYYFQEKGRIYVPPKQKYTRESILETALQIAKRDGLSAVVARNVGAELGCTVSPIFSYFKNMEELQQAVKDEALKLFKEQISSQNLYTADPKMQCIQMVNFAKEKPELFKIIFESKTSLESLKDVINEYVPDFENGINSLVTSQGVSYEAALSIYKQLWVQAYGLSSLIASSVIEIPSEEDVSSSINHLFNSEIMFIKSEMAEMAASRPSARSVVKVSVKSK